MAALLRLRFVALFVAFALLASPAAHAQPSCATGAPSVVAPVGTICGSAANVQISGAGSFSASAYLGIPYAQPPVGGLRWQNPQSLSALPQNPFQALQYGNACPQLQPGTAACPLPSGQSEDCLYLNVWTPSKASATSQLPVMVFIHGGAFIEGSGGSPNANQSHTYDGTYLAAAGNVIVVTLNYRLGALGFLGLNGITTASNNNFGFRDQIMALQWVQSNIASFGGDPGKVTIFGESAGAMSVGLHALSSSQSAGLFQAAIMESNPLGLPYKTLAEAETLGSTFQSLVGCSTASCLQALPACNLVAAELSPKLDPPTSWTSMASALPWAPAIDGTLILGQPISRAGNLNVPLILGTNQAEGVVFVALADEKIKVIPGFAYRSLLKELFGDSAAQIEGVQAYACGEPALDCSKELTQLITDYVFTCANRSLAMNAGATKPVYVYQFTQVPSFNVWPPAPACASQVCHGAELPFVFNTAEKVLINGVQQQFQAPEETLSQIMAGYWTAFGSSQNPNGGSRLNWPAFQSGSTYMILNAAQSTQSDPFATSANCTNLWNTIGYQSESAWRRFLAPAEAAKR